jgi:hypothetical protein
LAALYLRRLKCRSTGGQPNPRSAVLPAGSSTRRSPLTTTRSWLSERATTARCCDRRLRRN